MRTLAWVITRALSILFVGVVGFCVWFYFASNSDYEKLSGEYRFHQGDLYSTIVLHPDKTFEQELRGQGFLKHTQGGWHRPGLSGVVFTEQFLRLPGQKTYLDDFPDHPEDSQANCSPGHFKKILGLYLVLHLDAEPSDLTFRKVISR